MPIKATSTLSSEKSAEEVLGDLDNYLEQAFDPDQRSLNSSGSARTVSYRSQLKKVCTVCKETPSPLLSAVEANHKGCLQDILDSLAYLDVSEERDQNGDTAAHLAAEHGRTELLRLMCNYDRNVLEAKDHKGASPLHTSAYHGQLSCTRWILQHGGSVFQKDFDGATPAHYASASGHLQCLEELIPAHSRLANEQTYSGETPGIYNYVIQNIVEAHYYFIELEVGQLVSRSCSIHCVGRTFQPRRLTAKEGLHGGNVMYSMHGIVMMWNSQLSKMGCACAGGGCHYNGIHRSLITFMMVSISPWLSHGMIFIASHLQQFYF